VSHAQITTTLSILKCTNMVDAGGGILHVSQRFERFLDTYRRPDGQRWGGAQLGKATGGIVTRSYVTNLRKGRIESPGYAKMRAIAKVMGFSPEMWFEEDLDSEGRMSAGPEGTGIPGRLEHLFAVVKNPKTGEPYTNAEVARLSAGDLTEEEVGDQSREGHRSLGWAGSGPGGCIRRVALLPARPGQKPSFLNEEVLEALADERASAILRERARLSEREKEIVLGIVQQFGSQIDDA
jgi:transcriptional regulator with XRE-family HTH domain